MEYFVGAIVTLIAIFVTKRFLDREPDRGEQITITYSQTNVHELIRPFMPDQLLRETAESQLSKHHKEIFTRILIVDEEAYWIKENTFFTARIVEGYVDGDNAKPVDIIGMDKVQLDKMIFIVETLTKGN